MKGEKLRKNVRSVPIREPFLKFWQRIIDFSSPIPE